MAPVVLILLIFIFLIGLILGIDYGYIFYLEKCGDTPVAECINKKDKAADADTVQKQTVVTAKGSVSKGNYSALITLTFPLEGGGVSGEVAGDCNGTITGTYKGGDNGTINGNVFGSCSPFFVPIPAKATFSGTVNQQTKTIPISGGGSAAGFSGSGSTTLTYQ
jgi:hypothetical protein